MPIWLRRYTFESLKEYYRKESEEIEKAHEKAKGTQKLSRIPDRKPTYSSKARK
jgi:hypothetical protein